MKKSIPYLLFIGFSFLFIACGGGGGGGTLFPSDDQDVSSSSEGNKGIRRVSSYDDMPTCTARRDGTILLVEEMDSLFFCMYFEWGGVGEYSWESVGEYAATKKDMHPCDEEYFEHLYYIGDEEEYRICINEAWREYNMDSVLAIYWSFKSSSSFEISSGSTMSSDSRGSSGSQSDFPAGIKPAGYYDCDSYKCVADDYLNQDILEEGGYGEFLDDRNDMVYKVINHEGTIWMAQNLNIEVNDGIQSWCYDGVAASCDKYGRLYTWAAAVGKLENECGAGYTCNLPSDNIQGVCPEGWHLPNKREWNALDGSNNVKILPGPTLKSQKGWDDDGNGDDIYGFAAIPAGVYDPNLESFFGSGHNAYFWMNGVANMGEDANLGYCKQLRYNSDKILADWCAKTEGYSIRCVMD